MNSRIKQLREHLKLSQIELAHQLGVSQGTISAMELGNRPITERMVSQLVSMFGISAEWLRTGEGDMYPAPEPEKDELLAAFASPEIVNGTPTRKKFLTALCRMTARLDDEQILALCDLLDGITAAVRDDETKKDES